MSLRKNIIFIDSSDYSTLLRCTYIKVQQGIDIIDRQATFALKSSIVNFALKRRYA